MSSWQTDRQQWFYFIGSSVKKESNVLQEYYQIKEGIWKPNNKCLM